MVAQPGRMSVQDYLDLDRRSIETRYEFIDGYAYMLAGGTANHSTISGNVYAELRALLRGSPCRVYNSDMKVRLSETRYVYPDVSVSCNPQDRGTVDTLQSPRLVVEVLSASTEGYDRGRKARYYRACPTIEEYVLIDSQQQAIEVYRRERDFWKLYAFGPGAQVVLTSLGVSISTAAIYENTIFQEE
jgi:Uma2 family endonuclease